MVPIKNFQGKSLLKTLDVSIYLLLRGKSVAIFVQIVPITRFRGIIFIINERAGWRRSSRARQHGTLLLLRCALRTQSARALAARPGSRLLAPRSTIARHQHSNQPASHVTFTLFSWDILGRVTVFDANENARPIQFVTMRWTYHS